MAGALTKFTVRNEDFAERVRRSFARQGFMAMLGANLTKVAPGQVEITIAHDAALTQQHGFFHGGVVGAIADNAGGYASFSLLADTASILTVEYKVNLMAPARGELLIARGKVVRPGRTLTVAKADIFVLQGKNEVLCATMLGTFMALENTADEPTKTD